MRSATCFVACVLLALTGESLRAQEIRGTVVLADSVTPAVGVIIEALDPATGRMISRTLSGAQGFFGLRLVGSGSAVLRGLRIGQRPTEFGVFEYTEGQPRTERLILTGAAVVLDRVSVVEADVCGGFASDGARVATLFEEARKAITSTQIATAGSRLVAEWVVESRLETFDRNPITSPTARRFRSATDRPFVSLSPDSLAKVGYLATEGEGWVYQAPDADVLLSERFVRDHCFRAVAGTETGADLVGIAFRPVPARARTLVGIAGTLWIDRPTAELRRLDYDYVGVPRELSGTPAGGRVEFRRLSSGDWLVDRWEIRMPRPTVYEEDVFRAGRLEKVGTRQTMRITSMEVASGAVQEVRRGNLLLYTAAREAVIAAGGTTPESVRSLCSPAPRPGTGVVWGTTRDAAGAPLAGVLVRMEWEHGFRWLNDWQRIWDTGSAEALSGTDGFWFGCDIPFDARVSVTVARGGARLASATTRITQRSGGTELQLATGNAVPAATGIIRGTVFDSLRTLEPWRGADVRVLGTGLVATADSAGRFTIPNVPVGTYTIAVFDRGLEALRVEPPSQTVLVSEAAALSGTELATPSFTSVYHRVCSAPPHENSGLLIGEVRDLTGATRSGLTVRAEWERMLLARGMAEREPSVVESVTDSSGFFALCGLPLEGSIASAGNATEYRSGEFTVRVEGAGVASAPITLQMRGVGLARRDLIVGVARVARIGGRVLDALGKPVPDATVVVVGEASRTARTDTTGAWTIDSVPVRSTELLVRAIRFLPERRVVDPVGGRMAPGEIRLQRAPQMLAERTILGSRGGGTREAFEFRRAAGVGTFLDDDWIKKHPTITVTTVRPMIAKTRLIQDPSESPSVRYKLAFETDIKDGAAMAYGEIAAMGHCFPRWFIDGVDFGIPFATEEENLLKQAKRIEAYRAMEMQGRYIDFNGCGVILIWTYDLP